MSFDSEHVFKNIDPPALKKAHERPTKKDKPAIRRDSSGYIPRHAAASAPVAENDAPERKGFSGWLHRSVIIHKNDTPSEVTGKLVTITAIIVIIACIVILGKYVYEIYEAKQNHEELKTLYSNAARTPTETLPVLESSVTTAGAVTVVPSDDDQPVEVTTTEVHHDPRPITPAAAELLAINPDTVGFVRIPDCVEEPVVKGTDNDWYLTHNFKGQQRSCGTCFADYRNVIGDWERSDNVTLYAHNQRDGTMFGNLDYFRWDVNYWLKNPFIYFNTNYTEDTYVIISSFVINIFPEHDNGNKVFDYQNFINFTDSGDYTFDYFYSEIMKRSWFHTGIDCTAEDKYLTLSTCSTEWDDSRHVIVARMLRDGETTTNLDTTNFEKNPNPKWPGIYYKYNGGTYIEEDDVALN